MTLLERSSPPPTKHLLARVVMSLSEPCGVTEQVHATAITDAIPSTRTVAIKLALVYHLAKRGGIKKSHQIAGSQTVEIESSRALDRYRLVTGGRCLAQYSQLPFMACSFALASKDAFIRFAASIHVCGPRAFVRCTASNARLLRIRQATTMLWTARPHGSASIWWLQKSFLKDWHISRADLPQSSCLPNSNSFIQLPKIRTTESNCA